MGRRSKSVFLAELKKVFNPLRTACVLMFVAVSLGLCLQSLYMDKTDPMYTIRYMTFYHDLFRYYGVSLSEGERDDANTTMLAVYKAQLDTAVRQNPVFKTAGVTNNEDMEKLIERDRIADYPEEDRKDFENYDPHDDYVLTAAQKEAIEQYTVDPVIVSMNQALRCFNRELVHAYDECHKRTDIQDYKEFFSLAVFSAFSEKEMRRLGEVVNAGELDGTLPSEATDDLVYSFASVAVVITLSLFALLSPVITRDNMTGTSLLAFSTKEGRRVLKKQLYAMLASSFLLTTLELGILLIVLTQSNDRMYFGCTLNSFCNFSSNDVFWFNGTLGEYLMYLIAFIYLLAFACAALIFILSKIGKNYIALLYKVVPAATALAMIVRFCTFYPFTLYSSHKTFYDILPIPFGEAYVVALLPIVFTGAALLILKKNKTSDIIQS